MAFEHEDRDEILRAKLVARVNAPRAESSRATRLPPERFFVGLVTAVVLVVVVALSVAALRLSGDRGGPIAGASTSAAPSASPSAAASEWASFPENTLPPGKLLGRFTSADGPNQDHTIQVNGLGIATQFICTGKGKYSVWVAGGTSESSDDGCSGGGVGAGGGVKTTAKVRIRTDPRMKWTYTLIGIAPPKRVVLKPVLHPVDADGTPVTYCTVSDLAVRYVATPKTDENYFAGGGELVFVNKSGQPCALAGFPEVRFLSKGEPLGHNTMNAFDLAGSTKNGIQAVILKPGTSAYVQTSWYLPGDNKSEGPCVKRAVTAVEVGLSSDYTAPQQTGTISVPIGTVTACLNGEHGARGKYGQIAATVFLDYSNQQKN